MGKQYKELYTPSFSSLLQELEARHTPGSQQ